MQAHVATSTTTTTTTATSASSAYALNQAVTYPQVTSNNNDHTTVAAANTNTTLAAPSDPVSEPVQAYAKLEGDSFSYYIRTLQVTFGRKASSSDQVDIHLGPTKAISRQHARLFYNFTTQRFEMMVFGKNGAFVNDQFVEKGVTVPLENRTKIQIGEVSFSFLLPKLESDDHTHDAASSSSSGVSKTGGGAASGTGFHKAALTVKKETSTEIGTGGTGDALGDSKPPFSYASLIAQAINATPTRKLTLNGIYQHITTHYPYYQMSQNGWQNSIRHNLSLNKAFVKVPRSDSEPGKGAFWTIDQSCDAQFANGVYKRSRRATSSKPGSRPMSDSESSFDQSDKPRKRVNTGPEDGSDLSSKAVATASTTTPSQVQVPDASQINEASLKLATLLQRNPGMLALNLAALSQSLAAAHKEGIPSALLNGLMAAAKASAEQGGGAASIAETARVLAAHLQQPTAASTSKAPATPPATTLASAHQSLAAIQAIAASRANVTTPPPTATAASSSSAAAPLISSTPATIAATATSTSLPTTAAPASAVASPIAQLVAAAQAQARAAAAAAAKLNPTSGQTVPPAVQTPTTPPTTSTLPSTLETSILQAQAKALAQVQAQAQAQAQTQAQQIPVHSQPQPTTLPMEPPVPTAQPNLTETSKPQDSVQPAQDTQQK
ncbi:Pre-rRNA-processing protein fhl1 [Gryganskiella cystojenkinii]|nr:Pre-rRNA-processing protein fhl1 [Gryganskiella cystojenkinii]